MFGVTCALMIQDGQTYHQMHVNRQDVRSTEMIDTITQKNTRRSMKIRKIKEKETAGATSCAHRQAPAPASVCSDAY